MLSIFTVQEELMGLVQRDERARVLIALHAKPQAPTTESSSHFVLIDPGQWPGKQENMSTPTSTLSGTLSLISNE